MPNPTAIMPAAPEVASAHALAAGLSAFFAVGAAGAPAALLPTGAQVAGRLGFGYAGYGTGDPPARPASMTHTPTPDRALKFTHGSKSASFPATGWGSAGSTRPLPASAVWLLTFRHRMPQTDLVGYGTIANYAIPFSCCNRNYWAGPQVTPATGATRAARLALGTANGAPGILLPAITLAPDVWYSVAIRADATDTRFWVYDHGAQAVLTAAGGTAVAGAPAVPLATMVDAVLGHVPNGDADLLEFLGDVYAAALWSGAFSDALFASWYQDPYGVARGTYAPAASTLVAGDVALTDRSATTVTLTATRPTGGGSAGAYTYQWHRATVADFTPGAGNAVAGATALVLADTPPDPTATYFYKLVASDGTASVAYGLNAIGARCHAAGTLTIGLIGDSISWQGSPRAGGHMAMALSRALDRKVAIAQRGRYSSLTASATPNVSWAPGQAGSIYESAVAEFVDLGAKYALVSLGTNDAGSGMPVATYQANLSAIAADLVARSITPILSAPPVAYSNPGGGAIGDSEVALLHGYLAALDAVADGTTIRRAADLARYASLGDRAEWPDQTHPSLPMTAEGNALAWAEAVRSVVAPSASGTIPGVGDVRLGVAVGKGLAGTLALPAEAQVGSGVTFGAGGTEFTGTLAAGGGLTAAEVWSYADRALTDKSGFGLAADQSGVTIGAVNNVVAMGGTAINPAAIPDVNVVSIGGMVADPTASPSVDVASIVGTPLGPKVGPNLAAFFSNAGADTTMVVDDLGRSADWSVAERSQIRHRLGIDGEAAKPAAAPSLSTFDGGSVASVEAPVTVGTVRDKAGYSLAPDGLDAISVADPGGVGGMTTLPRMMVALWRRFFKKTTMTSGQLCSYGDDDRVVNTTQRVSDDGTIQVMESAS